MTNLVYALVEFSALVMLPDILADLQRAEERHNKLLLHVYVSDP